MRAVLWYGQRLHYQVTSSSKLGPYPTSVFTRLANLPVNSYVVLTQGKPGPGRGISAHMQLPTGVMPWRLVFRTQSLANHGTYSRNSCRTSYTGCSRPMHSICFRGSVLQHAQQQAWGSPRAVYIPAAPSSRAQAISSTAAASEADAVRAKPKRASKASSPIAPVLDVAVNEALEEPARSKRHQTSTSAPIHADTAAAVETAPAPASKRGNKRKSKAASAAPSVETAAIFEDDGTALPAPVADASSKKRGKRSSKAAADVTAGADEAADGAGKGSAGKRKGSKRKARSGSPSVAPDKATTTATISEQPYARSRRSPSPEVHTFADLLKDLPPAGHLAYTLRRWVVFSDLHVQEKSLDTCIQVVDRVLREAKARDAGVLFLGDWWHERGQVAFTLLNTCLRKLQQFQQDGVPLLMLVGNHDQSDLAGLHHGLTCLAAGNSMVHVFTQPTVFRDVLLLPYRRYEDVLMTAKDVAVAHYAAEGKHLTAVMAHADVATARYNAQYQARDGIDPGSFPQGIPVYTGHYHMPHTVDNTRIMYIGSPYQVSAAEAGQQKRLLVLDADNGWEIDEEVPIDLGTKFVVRQGLQQLMDDQELLAELGPDRIVKLVVNVEEQQSREYEELRAQIEATGAKLQTIVEVAPSGPRMEVREDSQPEQLLEQYAATREGRFSEAGLAAAKEAIQEAASGRAAPSGAAAHVSLQFEQVEVQGFGPFVNRLAYPLAGRGLRVVTGSNLDDAGADSDAGLCSNGSGKSTLVSAALWALTGEQTTRTESGVGRASGAVDSMLNDQSKEAEVVVTGTVDGKAFRVERAVKRGTTSRLRLVIDGESLTQQDKRATQELITDALCTPLLRYQAFVGQNDVQTLLEANDRDMKALLSQVVEMDIWDKACDLLKPQVRAVKEAQISTAATVKHLNTLVQSIQAKLKQLKADREEWQAKRGQQLDLLEKKQAHLLQEANSTLSEIVQGQPKLWQTWNAVEYARHDLQQEYDLMARQGTALPPPPHMPPPPSLEGSRHMWKQQMQQQQQQGAPATATVATTADPLITSAGADAAMQQAAWEQLALQREQLTAAQARLLEDRDQDLAHLRRQLEDVEDRRLQVERAHEARKHDASALQKQLSKRLRQLEKHGEGAVCDSCGQTIDRNHVQQHVDELQDEVAVAHKELEQVAAALKQARKECDAAKLAVDEATRRHSSALQQHQQLVDELNARERLLREEAHKAETRALHAAQEAVKKEREAERALQKGLEKLHAAREKEHAELVAQLERDHQTQVRAARAEHSRKLDSLRSRLQRLQAACTQVSRIWQQVAQCHEQCVKTVQRGVHLSLPEGGFGTAQYQLLTAPAPTIKPPADSSGSMSLQEEHIMQLVSAVEEQQSLYQRAVVAAEKLQGLRETAKQLAEMAVQTFPMEQVIDSHTQQMTEQQAKLSELDQKEQALKLEGRAIAEALSALGREGIQSYILERVLAQLQQETDQYLQRLSDTLRLELKATRATGKGAKPQTAGSKKRASKKSKAQGDDAATPFDEMVDDANNTRQRSPSVEDQYLREQITKEIWYYPPDGSARLHRDPAQLSGGERRRVALALLLGFAKLLRDSSRLTSNLFVLDEGLQQLDGDGCRRVFEVLREEPYDTILVVAQANSFATQQEHDGIDTVVKRRGCAEIIASG